MGKVQCTSNWGAFTPRWQHWSQMKSCLFWFLTHIDIFHSGPVLPPCGWWLPLNRGNGRRSNCCSGHCHGTSASKILLNAILHLFLLFHGFQKTWLKVVAAKERKKMILFKQSFEKWDEESYVLFPNGVCCSLWRRSTWDGHLGFKTNREVPRLTLSTSL